MFGKLRPVSELAFGSSPVRLRTNLAEQILSKQYPVTETLDGLREDSLESGFIDASAAVEANFIAAEMMCNVGTRVFLSEYTKHVDYQNADELVRWGVGLRFVFIVDTFDLSVNADTLPALAAAAELKLAKVSCSFRVIGIQGKAALKLFPTTQDTLDVQGVPRILEALDGVRSLIYSKQVTIKPWFLFESRKDCAKPTFVNSPMFRPALLALQCISKNYSLIEARIELAKRKLPADELRIVENVYKDYVKRNDDERPCQAEREAAARVISGA